MSHSQARSINETLREAAGRIQKEDATALMRWVLDVRDTWLFLHGNEPMPLDAAERFAAAVQTRAAGTPLAYIEGSRGFWSMELEVSPATLIPRVETELLVEAALAAVPSEGQVDVLDLGTGSGAIALAIAKERRNAQVVAIDQCAGALEVAARNASRHALTNVRFLKGDWYAPVAGQQFHCIVSNPPYIREDDAHLKQGDLRFEPISALASGEDGLTDIRTLVQGAMRHLMHGGFFAIEHGYDQGEAVRHCFENAGFVEVRTLKDLESRDRVTQGFKPTH